MICQKTDTYNLPDGKNKEEVVWRFSGGCCPEVADLSLLPGGCCLEVAFHRLSGGFCPVVAAWRLKVAFYSERANVFVFSPNRISTLFS